MPMQWTRPLKGPTIEDEAGLNKLAFPVFASHKMDGVRATVVDGVLLSTSGRPIPNRWCQEQYGRFEGLDGELIAGDFRTTMSAAMSADGGPMEYHCFDYWKSEQPFSDRLRVLMQMAKKFQAFIVIAQYGCHTVQQILELEQDYLARGGEGLVLRAPWGMYLCKRSTLREQALVKLKRYVEEEATVIGYEELLHNFNEPTRHPVTGKMERGHSKANKLSSGQLGALIARNKAGDTFSIGGGFTAADRENLWQERDRLTGLTVTYKTLKNAGGYNAPRTLIFKGFRDTRDLTEY